MCSIPRHIGDAALGFIGFCLLLAEPAVAQPTQAQQSAIRSNCRSDFMANCSGVTPGGADALHCLQRNVAKLSSGCQNAVNALTPPAAPQKQAAPTAPAPAAASPAPRRCATCRDDPRSQPCSPDRTTRQPRRRAAAARKSAYRRGQASPTASPSPSPAKPTPQQQAAIRQSCQSDFKARCIGVQLGGADALQCLQRNSVQLSPDCRRAVAAVGGGAPAVVSTSASAPAAAAMPTAEQQSALKFTCRRDFLANCRGVTPGGPEALACLQRNAARLSPDCRTSLAAIEEDGAQPAGAASAASAPAAGPAPGPFPLRRAIRERLRNQ